MITRVPSVDIAVVGGGIAGLAAAHRLTELAREAGRELDLVVLERSSRAGGPIHTESMGEALIEAGPDQFVTFKPAALELCRRLGLEHELVRLDGSRAPMQVLHRGRPVPLPAGAESLVPRQFGSASPLFTRRGRARMALERFVPRDRRGADESVASFVERRFGRELHERVVEPIIGGIFTADTRRLSAEMALPRLRALERTHGSLSRAVHAAATRAESRGFVTLKNGLQQLVDRLVARLPPGSLRCRSRVSGLGREPRDADGPSRFVLDVDGRPAWSASVVVLAAPAPACSTLLRALDADLGRRIGTLTYASCATVSLLYPELAARRKLEGYGFFAPADAGAELLACSYVHAKFPGRAPHDRLLLRAFLGGARHPHTLDADDTALARTAHLALARVLDIAGEPESVRVHRFPEAMPQYPVGFRDEARAVSETLARHAGLLLCGSASGAFGIPDGVASGERAADRAWVELGARATRSAARAASAG